MRLKDVALQCTDYITFNEEATKVFKTPIVCERLKSVMDLVIKALVHISAYYSRPGIGKSFAMS
jgi:hypothetical protein